MQRSLEQRMAIKFCVKLEKSAAETIPMLKKAFGVDCLSDRQIFAEGREDVNDENRAGRPSTSSSDDNVKRVRDLLNTDRRLSVRLISETLEITKTIVHEIVSESLGMRKLEQRVNLKFPIKLGKTFAEAYEMLQEVYGNECLSRTQDFEWFKQFKEGRETTEDDPHPKWPSSSKTDENIEKNW
ncbi:hypothetical protein NQ318_011125 [Aromia moschata]|uniref:Mos1 transposase HTH domain-containing protein n=1 Tax=Aromia moschata TaxID=1265417 RepID=A0AAV8YTW8_9CUCU|nr:hypothetical protein NQ318_011125 [Aromia moschata]